MHLFIKKPQRSPCSSNDKVLKIYEVRHRILQEPCLVDHVRIIVTDKTVKSEFDKDLKVIPFFGPQNLNILLLNSCFDLAEEKITIRVHIVFKN